MSHKWDALSGRGCVKGEPKRPLILILKGALVAVEPESGQKIWAWQAGGEVTRFYQVEERLLVCQVFGGATRVNCIDLHTGRMIGALELDFCVDAGLARDSRLFLAGENGAACTTSDGQLLWSIKSDDTGKSAWDMAAELTCKDPRGEVLWKHSTQGPNRPAGLILDGAVVQPDMVGTG